ncbi:MAG TPA: AI-2E family transporter [Desulfobacteraceae bacterium]|nr:AI-2E family transporter [Desulfobacteraceae bacterium]HPJ67180.1 AI-2E family transporter [Desulfobacteraceae bacterium]HPQ26840.1 AI-2E family transporter [Desulfobacteraceae bacterium]
MKNKLGNKFFLFFLLCSLGLVLSIFWTYVSAVVLALLIVSVSYPMYERVKRLFKGHENTASAFMLTFILLVIVIPFGWFVGTLSNEAFDFYNHTRNAVSIKNIQETLESDSIWAQRIRRFGAMVGIDPTADKVEKLAASLGKRIGLFLYNQISSIASNLFSFIIHFFLMLLIIYYLFRDGGRLREYITELLPVPSGQMDKLIEKFQEMGKAVVVGNGLSGIVQGILGGFGFFFFGLSSPFLWGTILGVMAFVPIIGASVIFVPAAIVLMIQGKIGISIGYLIYNILYSSIIEYLIKPRMIGKGMQMNSLFVFIGIIGGIKLFGILGIVYGPLIITVFLTLAEIYRLEYKEQYV